MTRHVVIQEAAELLGVSIPTLRNWVKSGKIEADRTPSGRMCFDIEKLRPEIVLSDDSGGRKTIAYVRVPGSDLKDALARQKKDLELHCLRQGWAFEFLSDIISYEACHTESLKHLMAELESGNVGRLVFMTMYNLTRFEADLIFSTCATRHIELVVLNKGNEAYFGSAPLQGPPAIPLEVSAVKHETRPGLIRRILDRFRGAGRDGESEDADTPCELLETH